MPYIYQIVNDINDKVYVGKTNFSLEKRFKEHCKDAFNRKYEKRPLYSAMRKYGVEHFHIELLEETDNPEEREKYWIEQKHSYENGYNATKGGDGKSYLDYDLIEKHPKLWLSISDGTSILNAVHNKTGLNVFYGAAPSDFLYLTEYNRANFFGIW